MQDGLETHKKCNAVKCLKYSTCFVATKAALVLDELTTLSVAPLLSFNLCEMVLVSNIQKADMYCSCKQSNVYPGTYWSNARKRKVKIQRQGKPLICM